jgi:hypothetical protein
MTAHPVPGAAAIIALDVLMFLPHSGRLNCRQRTQAAASPVSTAARVDPNSAPYRVQLAGLCVFGAAIAATGHTNPMTLSADTLGLTSGGTR